MKENRQGSPSRLMKEAFRKECKAVLRKQDGEAARMMECEYAAVLRDQIIELRGK